VIISEVVQRDGGTLAVSWAEDVRASDWCKTGNKKVRSWACDRLYVYLAYMWGRPRRRDAEGERGGDLEYLLELW